VPDWDNTESRERDEDAAWRDLIARFDAPPITQQPVPWPEREEVLPPRPPHPPETKEPPGADDTFEVEQARGTDETGEPRKPEEPWETGRAKGIPGIAEAEGPSGTNDPTSIPGVSGTEGLPGASGVDGTQGTRGAEETRGAEGTRRVDGARGVDGTRGVEGTQGTRGVKRIRGFDDEGVRGALDPDGLRGSREPDVIQDAQRRRRTPARNIRARQAPVDPAPAGEEDHYVPPPPPPLPRLDSIAKGAWAALFGGPAYLVVATVAHWTLSGFAAFCAVAAFVTGFAILVLRMNPPDPGGPDDGDDGAVI